jgi:hypothetical protein
MTVLQRYSGLPHSPCSARHTVCSVAGWNLTLKCLCEPGGYSLRCVYRQLCVVAAYIPQALAPVAAALPALFRMHLDVVSGRVHCLQPALPQGAAAGCGAPVWHACVLARMAGFAEVTAELGATAAGREVLLGNAGVERHSCIRSSLRGVGADLALMWR